MKAIESVFAGLKEQNKKAFVAYITAGDPDLEKTKDYCKALASNGVDIIELGVPFSDPLADGPTNQAASERALASGTTLEKILTLVKELRTEGFETPIILFSYLNPIFAMGYDGFADACKEAGVNGALVLDLPIEEADDYILSMRRQNLDTVFLASPTTSEKRLKLVGENSRGFLYYVSRTGVTGVQTDVSQTLGQEMKTLREYVELPVVIGFGISSAEQAKFMSSLGDGIVIGSAIVKIIEKGDDVLGKMTSFTSEISQALET